MGESKARNLVIRGAREHNLKNIHLELPRHRFIVFTGVSGSGKSSLAYDILYTEGQRRYIEALSPAARAFLGQFPKPEVDYIFGLSPALSIDQKTSAANPRSTVATITEIYDYLRVLFARVGTPHCVACGQPIGSQTTDEIIQRLLALPEGTRLILMAPIARGRKGEFQDVFEAARRRGFVRVRVDGEFLELDKEIRLDRRRRHDIDLVVDRLILKGDVRARLADSVELALEEGQGTLVAYDLDRGEEHLFSRAFACLRCGRSFPEPTPQMFSFNSPQGMCPTCEGLGEVPDLDPQLAVPDPSRSLAEGALALWEPLPEAKRRMLLEALEEALGFDAGTPWEDLPASVREAILYGVEEPILFRYPIGGSLFPRREPYRGALEAFFRLMGRGWKEREWADSFLHPRPCPACEGARLKPEALAVKVKGKSIAEVTAMTVEEAVAFFDDLQLDEVRSYIAQDLLKEIRGRLNFLLNVGLHYLTLNRSAPTLSGGEAQRIRLARQIGAGLVGVLYILDEPSIGLHPRDNRHLLESLKRLRDQGNTVIVVEHDEETIREADYVVDFGPGPGRWGGEVVAVGPPERIAQNPRSLTGQYLAGRRSIPIPRQRRRPSGKWLTVVGARHNNLKNLTVRFPLGVFLCVTGVSGSGKSSLVNDILYAALARHLNRAHTRPGEHEAIEGLEHLDKVIVIDQSPIGRTPRSNPATYTKALDPIRSLFASLPEAKARGYKPGRFSFNVPGGRCEACEGHGMKRIEMDFLADVWVPCEACGGKRFNAETLQVRYKGKNIAEVLEMTVAEALEHFENIPPITRILQTLYDVGLDYIQLGQPAPTLSGGEAQRIKLARELGKVSTGRTLYILDEPTTGLHFEDIGKLLRVLNRLVDAGNTVIVVEHNLEVIKSADYIIDLGPEGGEEGGYVVAEGTPEEVAQNPRSYTGQFLRRVLFPSERSRPRRPSAGDGRRLREEAEVFAPLEHIIVRGAREHNLKSVDVDIPRGTLTLFTGVSGSGKSSLALDTLYAEGQRRYVESLSTYARQFISQLEKPHVDYVAGLSPAISIEQKSTPQNPRSTVGTVTEVYDYLRILYARLGTPHCVHCGGVVGSRTRDEIVERILALPEGTRLLLLAPLTLGRTEEYRSAFERLRRDGFTRVRVDGVVRELSEEIGIDRRRHHDVEVVVDRVVVRPEERSRIADSVELALDRGKGVLRVATLPRDEEEPQEYFFSQLYACQECGASYTALTPQSFSFNSPLGWCPACEGLGEKADFDPELLAPDPALPLRRAILEWRRKLDKAPNDFLHLLEEVAKEHGFSLETPLRSLSPQQRQVLFYGDEKFVPAWLETKESAPALFRFRGLIPVLRELHASGERPDLGQWMRPMTCPGCKGERIRPEAAAVRFRGKTIGEVTRLTLREALAFFEGLQLTPKEEPIGGDLVREIRTRLRFLVDIGLGYLTLARPAPTLSGGEAQRIRLASQLGSGLTGVLYVLDEPSIGLHPRDNQRLLDALKRLRDLGNTVLVVEHDAEAIRQADQVFDFGPGPGALGGRIVAQGTPQEIARHRDSLTGQYLSGRRRIEVPPKRRIPAGRSLFVRGAQEHNLKDIDVEFPLGLFLCVTGVSGSGKSTLVQDILYNALAFHLHGARVAVGRHRALEGLEEVDKVILMDQAPIGTTPRSDPATYVGVFEDIRTFFAQLPEARLRGYHPRRFSFNVPGGRCEACWGYGYRKIEMHFLADVWVKCEVCEGRRYNRETLEITYNGKNIADVLEMTVEEALEHFRNIPSIRHKLQTLVDVGLGYLRLGQPAPTLSGGEAQRVKLARELSRPSTGRTVYILDEPTTGLHFEDVKKLLEVLQRLVEAGNTVIVIEHNMEVIKCADYIIDLGPEGGEEGGWVVAAGTPEEVALCEASHTGRILKGYLLPFLGSEEELGRRAQEYRRLREESRRRAAEALRERPLPNAEQLRWERWHKWHGAFAQRADARWSGDDLQAFLDLLQRVADEPLEVDWRHPEFVVVKVRGSQRWWCRIKTNQPRSFRPMFRGLSPLGARRLEARFNDLLKPWRLFEPPLFDPTPRCQLRFKAEGLELWIELVSQEEFNRPPFLEALTGLWRSFRKSSGSF